MMKSSQVPIVAVTGASMIHRDDHDSPLRVVRDAYFQLIEQFGGVAVLISNTKEKKVLDQYVSMFPYLLLTGGGDINPEYYDEPKDTQTGELGMTLDPIRDESELYLVKQFIKAGKPVLGICRGAQMINVALGGSLMQNISNTGVRHLTPDVEGSWYKKAHSVAFTPGTLLAKLAGELPSDPYMVNSVHHQAIHQVGEGLVVAAAAPDGIIEAIESVDMGKQFIMGVQWHPEQMRTDYLTELVIRAFLNFHA